MRRRAINTLIVAVIAMAAVLAIHEIANSEERIVLTSKQTEEIQRLINKRPHADFLEIINSRGVGDVKSTATLHLDRKTIVASGTDEFKRHLKLFLHELEVSGAQPTIDQWDGIGVYR